tara:strand:- start:11057 stop:11254 length:198 start_codon:yes stop_codon:yes gene_type:complete
MSYYNYIVAYVNNDGEICFLHCDVYARNFTEAITEGQKQCRPPKDGHTNWNDWIVPKTLENSTDI